MSTVKFKFSTDYQELNKNYKKVLVRLIFSLVQFLSGTTILFYNLFMLNVLLHYHTINNIVIYVFVFQYINPESIIEYKIIKKNCSVSALNRTKWFCFCAVFKIRYTLQFTTLFLEKEY